MEYPLLHIATQFISKSFCAYCTSSRSIFSSHLAAVHCSTRNVWTKNGRFQTKQTEANPCKPQECKNIRECYRKQAKQNKRQRRDRNTLLLRKNSQKEK